MSASMERSSNHTRLEVSSDQLRHLDQAMTGLLDALKPVDDRLLTISEVVEAWSDLGFDDRRYLGTAFPRLVNALLALEDQLK